MGWNEIRSMIRPPLTKLFVFLRTTLAHILSLRTVVDTSSPGENINIEAWMLKFFIRKSGREIITPKLRVLG